MHSNLTCAGCLLAAICLFAATPLSAQKMLQGGDWCSAHKCASPTVAAQDLRSDSIDILQTTLTLELDYNAQQIAGAAVLQILPKMPGVQHIRLDLLGMNVSGVSNSSGPVTWAYDGVALDIQFDQPLPTNNNTALTITYSGHGAADASNWGGMYWQSGYAYNLGVGFDADPHNFGRALFPCFDNFTERCTFGFDITTPAGKPAFCNGALVSAETLPDGRLHQVWQLAEAIPSYLACVASGPYFSFERSYQGIAGPIPVQIAVAPVDTFKLKNSFVHLPNALQCFEHWYGPYRWNKIGYSVVPFNSGAMEHATNIAYMRAAVDGTTAFETLMAHEFSHHWFGDLATCTTAEDMWLNEGWASYSEHLFTEWVYGKQAYLDAVETNFLDILQNAHVEEGGYRAISGVPHAYTYGTHVYHKGAAVVHNLRSYMGDSLFRQGLNAVLDTYQFDDWSSADLRDGLESATGLDLQDFFDDWVYQPGFAHFSVDSFQVSTGVIDTFLIVKVYVKQKLRGAEHFYHNVPLEFTFVNEAWQRTYRSALVSGENDTLEFHLPLGFAPQKVWTNTRKTLTLARAEKERVIKNPANYPFTPAKLTLNFSVLPDSALLRVEHHWAMPDTAAAANPNGYKISNRYWTVDGFMPPGTAGKATFVYDGKGMIDQLDAELFAQTSPNEDSVLLLYRPGPGHPWLEHPLFVKNTIGSANDRFGNLRADLLLLGDYTIGKGQSTSGTLNIQQKYFETRLKPNPTTNVLNISSKDTFEQVLLYSAEGSCLRKWSCNNTNSFDCSLEGVPAGNYWIVVRGPHGSGCSAVSKL